MQSFEDLVAVKGRMQLQGRDFFDSPALSACLLDPCTIALKIADKWGELRLQIDERKVSSSFNITSSDLVRTPYLRTMKQRRCGWKMGSMNGFTHID